MCSIHLMPICFARVRVTVLETFAGELRSVASCIPLAGALVPFPADAIFLALCSLSPAELLLLACCCMLLIHTHRKK